MDNQNKTPPRIPDGVKISSAGFCYICQHRVFQICTVFPDVLDNRFDYRIRWNCDKNTDKAGNVSCCKHNRNYRKRMQCK